MRKYISILIVLSLVVTGQIGACPVYAQSALAAGMGNALPEPGTIVHLSPAYNPAILKGIKVHPDNPFKFDFILDRGDDKSTGTDGSFVIPAKAGIHHQDQLKQQANTLIKYFLASLTTPEQDLWVNLSPYEKDRIVPESFGKTAMGRDLLAQDYLLKQITASLMYPEDEVGKKFWKRIYKIAAQKYGNTNIPINTFNKVWIVPEKAIVYENAKAGTAYVIESKLKVMLETDYLAQEKNIVIPASRLRTGSAFGGKAGIQDNQSWQKQIVRDIIIPELTKEVNEGKNFAQLRQVYQSLILATWYKKKIKDSIITKVYTDKNKVLGILPLVSLRPIGSARLEGRGQSPKQSNGTDVEYIYSNYLQAFKKGTYNYIKEEQDPITQQVTPKKYFSGGASLYSLGELLQETTDAAMVSSTAVNKDSVFRIEVKLDAADPSRISTTTAALGQILSNWQVRPDILQIAELMQLHHLSPTDIRDAASHMPGLKDYANPNMQETFQELATIFPYLQQIVMFLQHSSEFSKYKILFLGRDAELVHDAFRLYCKMQGIEKQYALFPGSESFWNNLSIETPEEKAKVVSMLENFGITPENIRRGDKFLILDTGFRGTIGEYVVSIVKKLFGDSVSSSSIEQAFDIRAISTSGFTPGDELVHYSKDDRQIAAPLMHFKEGILSPELPPERLRQLLPKTLRYPLMPVKPGYNGVDHLIAYSLQLFPQFHERYGALLKRGTTYIAVPAVQTTPRADIDNTIYFNDSIVHPVAAILVQMELVRLILDKTENLHLFSIHDELRHIAGMYAQLNANNVGVPIFSKEITTSLESLFRKNIEFQTGKINQDLITALKELTKEDREMSFRFILVGCIYVKRMYRYYYEDVYLLRQLGRPTVVDFHNWLSSHFNEFSRGLFLMDDLNNLRDNVKKEAAFPRDDNILLKELSTADPHDFINMIDGMYAYYVYQKDRMFESERHDIIYRAILSNAPAREVLIAHMINDAPRFSGWIINILEKNDQEIVLVDAAKQPHVYGLVDKVKPQLILSRSEQTVNICDFNDPQLHAQAQDIAIGRRNGMEIIAGLAFWVASSIRAPINFDYLTQRPASETLHRRIGNNFERTNLLIAMARSLGIKAEYGIYGVDKVKWVNDFSPKVYTSLERTQKHILGRFTVEVEGKERSYYIDLSKDAQLSTILRPDIIFHEHEMKESLTFVDDINSVITENKHVLNDEKILIRDSLNRQAMAKIEEIRENWIEWRFKLTHEPWELVRNIAENILNHYEGLRTYNPQIAEVFFKKSMGVLRDGMIAYIPGVTPRFFESLGDDPIKINLRIACLCQASDKERKALLCPPKPFIWHTDAITIGRLSTEWDSIGNLYPLFWATSGTTQLINRIGYTEADMVNVPGQVGVFVKSGLILDEQKDPQFVTFDTPVKVDTTIYPFLPSRPYAYWRLKPPVILDGIISQRTLDILSDKTVQATFLSKYHIPAPRTVVVKGKIKREKINQAVNRFKVRGIKKIFLKSAQGFRGREVVSYKTTDAWRYLGEAYWESRRKGIVLQEAIDPLKVRLTLNDINKAYITKKVEHFWSSWVLEEKDLIIRLNIYRKDGHIAVRILAKPGDNEHGYAFMDINQLKDRLIALGIWNELIDKLAQLSAKIYTSIEQETGEDPIVITPDIIVDKKGNPFVLELNPGFDSIGLEHTDLFRMQGMMTDILDNIITITQNRQKEIEIGNRDSAQLSKNQKTSKDPIVKVGQKPIVVFIDDHRPERELFLKSVKNSRTYEFHIFKTQEEALVFVQKHHQHIGLVITDTDNDLTDMQGPDFIKALQKNFPQIPAVAISIKEKNERSYASLLGVPFYDKNKIDDYMLIIEKYFRSPSAPFVRKEVTLEDMQLFVQRHKMNDTFRLSIFFKENHLPHEFSNGYTKYTKVDEARKAFHSLLSTHYVWVKAATDKAIDNKNQVFLLNTDGKLLTDFPAEASYIHLLSDSANNNQYFIIDSDAAMNGEKGGIDLAATPMKMQAQHLDGEEIKFHIDPAMLQQLQQARGFVPIITNIQPMTDIKTFLGVTP